MMVARGCRARQVFFIKLAGALAGCSSLLVQSETRAGGWRDVRLMQSHDNRWVDPTGSGLDLVEAAVDRALRSVAPEEIADPRRRQSAAIARRLRGKIDAMARRGSCRRCWLLPENCVCDTVAAVDWDPGFRRIFVVMHHKEVGLVVDTAKLIRAAFPGRAFLIVGGLGEQPAEDAMMASVAAGEALVLFPRDDSRPIHQVVDAPGARSISETDLVVIDGTWNQARKLERAISDAAPRVHLSANAVDHLSSGLGRQLRPHPTAWRQVSTLEALRLLLCDIGATGPDPLLLSHYQDVADAAARVQLGPKRRSPKYADHKAPPLATATPPVSPGTDDA